MSSLMWRSASACSSGVSRGEIWGGAGLGGGGAGSGEAGRGLTGAGLDCGTWLVAGGGAAGGISGGVSGLVASGLGSGLGSGREGEATPGGAACNVRFLQPQEI